MQRKLPKQMNQAKLPFSIYCKWQRNCWNPPVKTSTPQCTTPKSAYKHKCKQHQAHGGSPFKKHKLWNPRSEGGPSHYSGDTCSKCGDSKHQPGFYCPAQKFKCQNCHKIGHFTSHCFHRGKQDKYHKNKPKDVHGITTQDGKNESNTLPVESDQESTSSNESFFVGTITAVNKVTVHDNTIFLIDLPITTKVHHKCWQMLHLKADSGAMKNVMTKQLYVSLTGDKFFNELGPPECLLKGYGEKAQICNIGTCKFFLWHGRWPYEVTFQISSEKDELTLLGGADSLWSGLIKWLGSVDTTQEKSKNTQNAPQNDKLIHSLEDLKTQYPDLIDETTIGTFPGDKYHINVDTTIPPKWTAPRPVPIHQQAQFKAELNKMLKLGVIKPVTEATPWISSFVIVESKKDTLKQKTNNCFSSVCFNENYK